MKIFLIERNVSQWFLTLAFKLSKTKIYRSLVSVVLVPKNQLNRTISLSPGTVPSNLMIDHIKSELCRQGVLEELINFNLKRHLLFSNSSPTPPPPAAATTATTAATTAPGAQTVPTTAQVVAQSVGAPAAATTTAPGTSNTQTPSNATPAPTSSASGQR